jgi:hypothetical protein
MYNKFTFLFLLVILLFTSCNNHKTKEVKGGVLEKHFTDSILKNGDSLMIKSIEDASGLTVTYH